MKLCSCVHFVFQSLSGGILNKTLKIVHDGDTQDGLILRIDGPVPEQVYELHLIQVKIHLVHYIPSINQLG